VIVQNDEPRRPWGDNGRDDDVGHGHQLCPSAIFACGRPGLARSSAPTVCRGRTGAPLSARGSVPKPGTCCSLLGSGLRQPHGVLAGSCSTNRPCSRSYPHASSVVGDSILKACPAPFLNGVASCAQSVGFRLAP
jgi:hypothetical protein